MEINELTNAIRSNPNADMEMLQEMLELEMQKPEEEWDYDRIIGLSSTIMNEQMTKEQQEQAIQHGLDQTLRVCSEKRLPVFQRKWVRWAAAACACLAVLLGANGLMLHATGVGLIKRIYTLFDTSFSFDFSEGENNATSLAIGESGDPYSIRSECEKYGFSPLVPQYRPEGFESAEIEHQETDQSQYVSFLFQKAEEKIIISYHYYANADDVRIKGWGIPSDTHNVSELDINGVTVTVSQEDQQYVALFLLNHTVYSFGAYNMDYAEAEHILRSMFE